MIMSQAIRVDEKPNLVEGRSLWFTASGLEDGIMLKDPNDVQQLAVIHPKGMIMTSTAFQSDGDRLMVE